MARKTLIQIRRGLESALGTLAAGELGYCTDTGKLFIGSAGGNVLLASGQGTGDMLKSIYDTNNNGKVDYAQAADTVPWSGVDGKPSVYPAAAHTHDYLPKGPLTWNQLKGCSRGIWREHVWPADLFRRGGPQDGPEVHAPDLMKYLPEYYRGVPEMEALQASAGAACGEIAYALADSDDQKTLDSATWGLARWERMLGLTTDTNKSYATRREMIKAKLRGSGTTTPEMIRRTASAFSGEMWKWSRCPERIASRCASSARWASRPIWRG